VGKPHPIEGLRREIRLLDAARRILPVRLDEIYSYAESVDDASAVRDHHNMRIAAKRLRYTMETFSFLFPDEFKQLISQVRHIQDLLGRVHDYDVFVPFFEDYVEYRRTEVEAERQRAAFSGDDEDEPSPTLGEFRRVFSAADRGSEREVLLRLIERTRARRVSAFADFQEHWRKLEEHEFRATLLGLIAPLRGDRPVSPAESESPELESPGRPV
jgi:CHAD domain-containing protein